MADYYSVIFDAVSRSPSKTDEARRVIYERARIAAQEILRNYSPPLSEIALANEQAALDAAISRLETDFSFRNFRRGAKRENRKAYSGFNFWRRIRGWTCDAHPHQAGLPSLYHLAIGNQQSARLLHQDRSRELWLVARVPDFRQSVCLKQHNALVEDKSDNRGHQCEKGITHELFSGRRLLDLQHCSVLTA